jgi:type II secretion system protein C
MQALRLRFQENGPTWVSWFLAALIAAEFARAIVVPVVREHRVPPAAVAPRRVPPPTARLDPQAIIAAHLFGRAARDSVRDPSEAAPAAANLHLLATFATADPRHGMAIIADGTAEHVYRAGEPAGGISVYSVYTDHVLLDGEEGFRSLALPRAAGVGAAPPPAAVVAAAASDPEERHRLGDVIRADPSVDEDSNKLLGFRLRAIPPASSMVRTGLRPGDFLTAINGITLADQDRQQGQQLMDSLLASSSGDVSVVRGGAHVDVAVAVDASR